MYKITEKVALNPTVTKMVIEAPLIAKKAKPGQFIIVRPFEDSERIPLTVAGYDREKGTVDIIFQIVGGTTMELNSLNAGDSVHDFVGPLGRATETEGLKKVCVVGGGVGCAIALPIARELHEQGCVVHSVVGFRSKDLLILEDEFRACSDELRIMTDDGSYGTKGVVTAALDELVAAGNQYDLVITIGPLIMMKFVVKTCQKHGLKSIVSMNPIMIDGTGMCGGCRLTVGGETKFACVDGSDLANFINTVQLEASGAQIASSALPNEFKGLPTEVTIRDVVSTYIYTNTLVVLEMTRPALKQYIERSAAYFDHDEDGNLCIADEFLRPKVQHYNYDFFSGIHYTIDARNPVGQRVTSIVLDGRELGEDEPVTVCVNSYRFCGTGGYDMLPRQKVAREVLTDVADAMIDYITSHPNIRVDTEKYCTVIG